MIIKYTYFKIGFLCKFSFSFSFWKYEFFILQMRLFLSLLYVAGFIFEFLFCLFFFIFFSIPTDENQVRNSFCYGRWIKFWEKTAMSSKITIKFWNCISWRNFTTILNIHEVVRATVYYILFRFMNIYPNRNLNFPSAFAIFRGNTSLFLHMFEIVSPQPQCIYLLSKWTLGCDQIF